MGNTAYQVAMNLHWKGGVITFSGAPNMLVLATCTVRCNILLCKIAADAPASDAEE